jgi:hypothetical protein
MGEIADAMTTAAQPADRPDLSLYAIEDGLRRVTDDLEAVINDTEMAEAAKVEMLDALMARLAELQGTEADKIENCWRYRQSVNRSIDARKAEIDRLAEMNRAAQRRLEWLNKYVEDCLRRRGDKLKTDLFSVWIQKNPPALELGDETKLPPPTGETRKFWKFHAPTPDNAAVKDALKAGETVGEARITQGESLRWR